eukprot:TRINITY_DN6124_c0_g1_i3.p1 TRINITY_DN6124_c0_g1~~TRINITY_DN6124_c0_g1_i3.p1  ORF type:complete len:257 (+),score=41.24 TRINITY_DN6124_c0_g1_i3:818-1588(+)
MLVPPKDCSTFEDCTSCTLNVHDENGFGCGWCNVDGSEKCAQGDINGPKSGSCKKWAWDIDTCSDHLHCGDHKDCHSCISDLSFRCGWCEETKSCIQGSNLGPYVTCNNFRYGTCEDSCYNRKDCSNCIDVVACGWCKDNCVLGYKTGPKFESLEMCSPEWEYNTCTGSCDDHKQCSDCTNSGCFWCPKSETCTSDRNKQCCNDCENCITPRPSLPSSWIIIISGVVTVGFALILSIVGHTFYHKYWTKRHYFQKL